MKNQLLPSGMQVKEYEYPKYARSEVIADGTMHMLGLSGAVVGATLLIMWSMGHVSGEHSAAVGIYSVALVTTFLASACYHMTPWECIRPALRRFDHAAIYVKIAGTYTPLVALAGGFSSYAVLVLVWAMAIVGVIRNLVFWHRPSKSGPWMFLLMGWMSLGLIWSVSQVVPGTASWLIVLGGLLYTFGVIFYKWESLKFSNAIWHGFVIVASACFYGAICIGFDVSVI